jgi:hypothetical protein
VCQPYHIPLSIHTFTTSGSHFTLASQPPASQATASHPSASQSARHQPANQPETSQAPASHQPTSQPASQSGRQAANQPASQAASQAANQSPAKQSFNKTSSAALLKKVTVYNKVPQGCIRSPLSFVWIP